MKILLCGFLLAAGCSSTTTTTTNLTPVDGGGTTTPAADSGDTGDSGAADSGKTSGDAATSDGGGGSCTVAAEQLLTPVDKVSTGDVAVLSDTAGIKTIYVDASAGGPSGGATNARLYLNLETVTKVQVTDKTAASSTAWDLSLKRSVIFTNDGAGGSGMGGASFLKNTDFSTVTSAAGATLATEKFFDSDCNAVLDEIGSVKTTLSEWYDYDASTHVLTPHPGTFLVRGGTGKLYKVEILSYYATSDGGVGMAGGKLTLKVGAL